MYFVYFYRSTIKYITVTYGCRYIWTFVICLGLAGMVYLLYNIAEKLINPPLVTKVTTKLEKTISLPAFTLCNYNSYNKSLLKTDSEMAATGNYFISGILKDIDPIERAQALQMMGLDVASIGTMEVNAVNLTHMFYKLAHSKEASIKVALNRATRDKLIDKINYKPTDMGICLTYHDPNHAISESGARAGIELILDVHSDQYMYSEHGSSDMEGFKVISTIINTETTD